MRVCVCGAGCFAVFNSWAMDHRMDPPAPQSMKISICGEVGLLTTAVKF